ncbi:aldolase [Lithospermum erythrorhizon]|uniref:fructose-bisphosphate aldolase n=1 Tax=Lithospermum erythrorhizon TaxID=34254 RepID=A0AAV3PPW2_LITER
MWKSFSTPGQGIMAIDESNATCGKYLASIGLENEEANRKAYQTLLVAAPGKKMVDVLIEQNIVPGIKVDKGLVPLAGSNDNSWCQGLDDLASRFAAYYQQGSFTGLLL